MKALGIDFGFGFTKYSNRDREGKVRTLVSKIPEGYSKEDAIEHEERFYLVGEEATLFKPTPISSVERLVELSPVLLKRVLKEVEKPEVIVTGLPPAYYEKYKNSMKEILGRASGSRVEVTRQGVGILFSVEESVGDSVLVLDVGFNTLDWIYAVRSGSKWKILHYQTVPKMGISYVVRSLKRELESEHSHLTKISLQEFEKAFEEGKLRLRGKDIDLTEKKEEVLRDYVRNLIEEISYSLDEVMEKVDSVVVGGGGAYYLKKEVFKELHDRVLYPSEPYELAQARGYRKIAEGLL